MGAQVVDHSYLSSAAMCLKQWELRYKLHFRPKQESVYLVVGSAFHKAMEVLYGPDGFDRVDEAVGAALAYMDGSGLLFPPGDERFDYLTHGHVEVCIRNYADHWRKRETYTTVRLIEEPLVSEALGLGGIVDMVVADVEGNLRIMDHKTSFSYLGKVFEERSRFSYQFPIYCALVSELFGQDVRSVVVNGVYLGQYAVKDDFKGTRYLRKPWTLSQGQIDEAIAWKGQIMDLIEGGNYPRSRSSHCRYCDFKEYCNDPPEMRPSTLGQKYITWRPTGVLLSGADSK